MAVYPWVGLPCFNRAPGNWHCGRLGQHGTKHPDILRSGFAFIGNGALVDPRPQALPLLDPHAGLRLWIRLFWV